MCKPPTTFGWNIQAPGFTRIVTAIKAPESAKAAVTPFDANGDGLTDLAVSDDASSTARRKSHSIDDAQPLTLLRAAATLAPLRRFQMKQLAFVVLVLVSVAAAWSAGFAQARVADFEISIDAPTGEMRVMCSKGCDWTPGGAAATSLINYKCERQPCQLRFNGRGRIMVGIPVAPTKR